MAESERRTGNNRRKGPIRTAKDRRDPAVPASPKSTRSGQERRRADRRKADRRKAR